MARRITRFSPWVGSPGVVETVDLDPTPSELSLALSAAAQPATFEGIAQDVPNVGSPVTLVLQAQAQAAHFTATLDDIPTHTLTLAAQAQAASFDGQIADLPVDFAAVLGAQLDGWHDADHVNVISTSIDQITDRGSGGHHFTATGTARPTKTAADATLSNLATIGFDGSNDTAIASGWALSTPSLSNRNYVAIVMKQNAFTASRNIVADSTSAFCVLQMGTASGRTQQNNATARNDNTGLGGTGTWGLLEGFFSASTKDCLTAKGRWIHTDTSAGGNGPGTARKLGTNAGGTSFANMQVRLVIHAHNVTLRQLCQIRALIVADCGSGVLS